MSTEIAPISEVERDALCEVANVAMARAATSIRRMVGRQILLSVPTCDILSPEAAAERLTKPGNPHLVAVRQDFSGIFTGRALLIFPEQGSLELMHAILGRQIPAADILDLEDEALAETGNVILNSWLATLANLLKQSLKMSLPVVIRRDQHHIFENIDIGESVILFLHIKFEVSERKIQGYVALMMDLPSIEQLRTLIAEFLSRLASEPSGDLR
jgi:chemotaxis protein CheC